MTFPQLLYGDPFSLGCWLHPLCIVSVFFMRATGIFSLTLVPGLADLFSSFTGHEHGVHDVFIGVGKYTVHHHVRCEF